MLNSRLNTARQLAGLAKSHLGRLVKERPELLPKLAANYARMTLGQGDVLRTASIAITGSCNATCGHCSADHMMTETTRRTDMLNLEEYGKAIEGFLSAGAISVNITGGEPLVSPLVYDIIRLVPKHRGVVNIQTNGLLLDDDVARKLSEAGTWIVMISLHSHQAHEHDALLEVDGAFDKVMQAIDNCHRYSMPVILNCTLTHQKVQDGVLWAMVDLAREKNVTVNFVQPCTTGKWEEQREVALTADDYAEFDKAMKLPWVVWEGKTNYKVDGCRPGIERLYMSATGDIIPCAFIHLNFGNVKKETVSTIWGRVRRFERFRTAPKRCMASNDEEFYDEYITEIRDHDGALLPIEEHSSYAAQYPEEAAAIIR